MAPIQKPETSILPTDLLVSGRGAFRAKAGLKAMQAKGAHQTTVQYQWLRHLTQYSKHHVL